MSINRNEIIQLVKKYFTIQELVCPHVYKQFGEDSWKFLSTELLHTIYMVRHVILKVPMYINGGNYSQRGLRCNLCSLVKAKTKPYLSAHVTGNGIDFTCKEYTAEQIRQKIKENYDVLPYNIRLEENVSWCHIDVYDEGNNKRINTFTD